MKHIGKVKVILTLACLAAILFSCITFNSIVWPSDPQADTGRSRTIFRRYIQPRMSKAAAR